MSASEFLIVAAIIIVGLIFVIAAQNFIFGKGKETKEYEYKAEGESLVALLNRIEIEPTQFVSHTQYISLSNITVKDGILIYERNGVKHHFLVSKEVKDVFLESTTSLCIMKSKEGISLSVKCACNYDSICTLDECKESCYDCYGPKLMCIGDGFCNKYIKEDCDTSSKDCSCDSNQLCCLEAPDADEKGCSNIEAGKLKKGEECWCNSQCEDGLNCNPTKKGFTNYKRACCDSEKRWDGQNCVSPKVYHLVFVPIAYSSAEFDTFKNDAEQSFNFFLQKIPLKECSDERDRIEMHVVKPGQTPECQIAAGCEICYGCNSLALACVNSIPELKGIVNKVAALCKGSSSCVGACGCANGIPGTSSSSNMAECRGALYEIPSHEIGHTMGLGHVDCDVACHACMTNDCNCADCSQPAAEKRLFIMDYCNPFEKYGPAAYQCLKDGEFKDYMC